MSQNRHRARKQRLGQTLVLVVLLIFGIMALAALVIDLGYARLAQRQMQTATDGAALEGLRYRDVRSEDIDGEDPNEYRRKQARQFARLVFDDDLDTTSDPRHFGAGPLVEFRDPVGEPSLHASEFMSIRKPPVYKPRTSDGELGLELNTENKRYGDMVAGSYIPNGAHDDEDATYQRSDFDESDPEGDAFMVRMRRTTNPNGLDDEGGVSSHGLPVPLLFGRGALLLATGASNPNSIWSRGITVRATAIATAYPVMSVGPAVDDAMGALPFAIYRSVLESSSATEPSTIDLSTSGFVTDVSIMSFGQLLERSSNDPPAAVGGYAAVVEDDHICGFVYLEIMSEASGEAVITPGRIANENATTAVVLLPDETVDLLPRLFEIHRHIRDDELGNRFLLAPALAPSTN